MSTNLRIYAVAFLASFMALLFLPISSSVSGQPAVNYSDQFSNILKFSQMRLHQIASSSSVSKICKEAVAYIESSAKVAAIYLDAAGKPPGATLIGNSAWLGSYSECTREIPQAHYCLAYVNITLLSVFVSLPAVRWGVCVPKVCSEEDVIVGLAEAFKGIKKKTGTTIFELIPQPVAADTDEKKAVFCAKPSEYTTGVILTLTLCGFILFLVLVGTVLDVFIGFLESCSRPVDSSTNNVVPVRDDRISTDAERFPYFANDLTASQTDNDKADLIPSFPPTSFSADSLASFLPDNIVVRFFLCFSLIQNTRRIMDTTVPPGAITSLNGMRVLSMWWVVLGHTYLMQLFGNVSNIFLFPQIIQRFTFQTIDNATYSVDSFFFLSGLLVSYLSLRQVEKTKGRFPIFKFYFHRFWRLTPTYMFVLLFYDKLTGFLGEGPMWYAMQSNPPCDKYWWTNLLYINNFYPTKMGEMCMGWSWYLANDMQFFIISPIIIMFAYRFRLPGILAAIAPFLVGSFLSTALIMHFFDLSAAMFGEGAQALGQKSKHDTQSLVYVKPYCRIAPYLVGMFLGYVFHVKKRRIPMVYLFNVIGWCVAIVLALSTLYGEYKVLRKHNPEPFNTAENITYGTFSRFAWSLALAWVIFACHRGLGGLVDKILSARFWIPLSRLTYSVYLVHIIVINVFFFSLENGWAFSDVHVSFMFAGTVALSYAAAFIVSVCVEFPMMQLEKLIFKTNR